MFGCFLRLMVFFFVHVESCVSIFVVVFRSTCLMEKEHKVGKDSHGWPGIMEREIGMDTGSNREQGKMIS